MSLHAARLWHMPRLLQILWAGTRASGPVARARHEDMQALGKLVWQRKVLLWKEKDTLKAFLARDGVRIHALYTCPEWRGQGAGGALLSQAQKEITRLELFTAEANAPARRFYRAHGFTERRKTDGAGNDEGIPDVFMTWEASAS